MGFSRVRYCQTTEANHSFHESLISQSKHMQPLAALWAEKVARVLKLIGSYALHQTTKLSCKSDTKWDVFLLSSVGAVWSFGTVWRFVTATTDARGKQKCLVMAERRRRKMVGKHWIWCVSDMLLVVSIAKFGCVENKKFTSWPKICLSAEHFTQ